MIFLPAAAGSRVLMLRAIFSVLAIFLLLITVNGCGSTNTTNMVVNQAPAQSLAFVSNSGSGTVSAFTVGTSGTLTPVYGSPFAAGAGAEFMAFDATHNLLFVSNQSAASLSVFAVNTSSGVLTTVPGSPFAVGSRPTGVAVSPAMGLVFVGNQNDSSVSVFSINSQTGSLTPATGSPVTGIANPFGLAVNPAGTLLFVNNFRDDPTGGANAVSAFQIHAGGSLTASGSPFSTSSPAGLTTPVGLATDGQQLFVGDHMAEAISTIQINGSTGALSASTLPPPNTTCTGSCHNNPLRLSVDPADKFVFATNVAAGTVTSFSIHSGFLTPVTTANTGQHPFGVASDPSGSFLFVVNKVDNTISGFSVDPNSGMLTPLPGFPFSGNLNAPTDIVVVKKM
jgi:6-phosphogluconolactonase